MDNLGRPQITTESPVYDLIATQNIYIMICTILYIIIIYLIVATILVNIIKTNIIMINQIITRTSTSSPES